MGIKAGKEGDNYKGSGQLWGGYSFNPQRGSGRFRGAQEGVAGYLGANVGGNVTFPKDAFKTGDQSNVKLDPFANAVATLGLKGEWKPKNDYIAHKTGFDKSPLRYGAGVYYKHPIMGEQGSSVGAYGNVGKFSLSGGYNTKTGKEFKVGYGIPIRQTGGIKNDIGDTIVYPPGDDKWIVKPFNKEILDIRPKLQKKGLYNIKNKDLQKAWEWEKDEKQRIKNIKNNQDVFVSNYTKTLKRFN